MSWYSKEQPTPFDNQPTEGLFYLIGDVLAKQYRQHWLKDQKYPLITFPSNLKRELIAPQDEQSEPMVHIVGGVRLPRRTTRDEAYDLISHVADDDEYQVMKLGADRLIVTNTLARRSYQLVYDNAARELKNMELGWNPGEMMDLLPGELRALLPKLYTNEYKGLEAIAPLKFFTPDSNWTWYPSEFDGEDTFFGLVSGFEVELGYFSLSELESVRGGLSLPIERDLYFQPKTLRELKAYHEQN